MLRRACPFLESWEYVDVGDHVRIHDVPDSRAGFANDERQTDTGIVKRRLGIEKWRTIVAQEDDQSVICKTCGLELLQYKSNSLVEAADGSIILRKLETSLLDVVYEGRDFHVGSFVSHVFDPLIELVFISETRSSHVSMRVDVAYSEEERPIRVFGLLEDFACLVRDPCNIASATFQSVLPRE